jgi:hypothetical protein
VSNAELVCLAVAQVLLGARSERHWLRMCSARLGRLFPCGLPGWTPTGLQPKTGRASASLAASG